MPFFASQKLPRLPSVSAVLRDSAVCNLYGLNDIPNSETSVH